MWKRSKDLANNEQGSFLIFFAISALLLLTMVGVALDMARLTDAKSKAQDHIDAAVLAAAASMRDSSKSDLTDEDRQALARIVARDSVNIWRELEDFDFSFDHLTFSEEEIIAHADGSVDTVLASIFGVDSMAFQVSANTSSAAQASKPVDVDVILISDITGSMSGTLSSVQANMKNFSTDLTAKLVAEGITPEGIRVKVIFYRDYRSEGTNAMHESEFFQLPAERRGLDGFVDRFSASGGGDWPESGLEAVWKSLISDWKEGNHEREVTRAIILWTDAPANNLHRDSGGAYPADAPRDLNALRSLYLQYHEMNSGAGVDAEAGEEVISMSINLTTSVSLGIHARWLSLEKWPGVNLHTNINGSSRAGYEAILDQVVTSVLTQAVAKDIAITH